jgi:outer membrane protein assembly factor BamB
MDYGRRLFALDAGTGALAWEYGALALRDPEAVANNIRAAGPAAAEGVVVLSPGEVSVGLDGSTGRELWRGAGGNALTWSSGGRSFFIVGPRCLEPKTGRVLWELPADANPNRDALAAVVAEDRLVGIFRPPSAREDRRVVGFRLSERGAERAWSVPAPSPVRDTCGLTVYRGYVYISGEKAMHCVGLRDGATVARADGAGGADTQVAFAADGRVFVQPLGRYGDQVFLTVSADPAAFRLLGPGAPAPWSPPHPQTTAHANFPLVSPLVDGRLFVRGADGIYCYDLRKP